MGRYGMKNILQHVTIVFACLVLLMPGRVMAQKTLTLYMTPISGQTMSGDSEAGIALEITREVVKRAGIALEEKFVPWARAVNAVENSSQAVIIPFSRTPSREKLFTWIIELPPLQFGFVSLETPIDDMDMARGYSRIGVWRATSMEDALRRAGLKNIYPVSNDEALIRMLINGRIDAWYGSLSEAAYKFRAVEKINRDRVRFGTPVKEQSIWLAGGPKLSAEIADQLRAAIGTMRQDNTIHDIVKRYNFDEQP